MVFVNLILVFMAIGFAWFIAQLILPILFMAVVGIFAGLARIFGGNRS